MTEDRDKAKEERQNAVKEVSQLKKDRDKEKEERQNNAKANRQLKVTVRKFLCQALIERWGRVLAGAVGDLMPTPKKKTPQERKAYWKYKAPSSVFFDLFRFIIDDSHPESSTFRPPLVAALATHKSNTDGLGIVLPSGASSFVDAITASMIETTPIYSNLSTDIHNTGRPVASQAYLEPAMTLPACNGNPYLLWIGEMVEGQVFRLND